MEYPTIGLAMIVKGTDDEAPLLEQCLNNISSRVDKIYLNINNLKGKTPSKKIIDIAKKYNTEYYITEWKNNFVESRKFIFDKVKEEFILWLDSDDTVDNPEEIKKAIAILSKNQHGIYVNYDYDHDEYGNVTVSHYVARIVRNNGTYDWKSSIDDGHVAVHETLCEVTPRPKAICNDFKIIHHAEGDRRLSSLTRNITLLEGMYERQKENNGLDPRTLFYLATHYYDAGNYKDAVELLRDYLVLSGWAEERCEAHIYLGNIYKMFEDKEHAYEEYIRALGEYQNSPRPYIELSKLSYEMGRHQDSADWIDKCLKLPKPTTTMVLRPQESTFGAYMLGAQAYVNIGGKKLDKAKTFIEKALKLRPLDKDAKKSQELIDNLIGERENIRSAVKLIIKFENDKQNDKIIPFIDSLPLSVQDNPLILAKRHHYTKPKIWGDRTIAIYVGQGPLGIWGPWSLESGIGGSEEAVIQLSNKLMLLGWHVTVYATPGDRGGHSAVEGRGSVMWKQYYEFNPNDEYNIVVAWRNPSFFDFDLKAKKKYLWLHDVMPKEDFLQDRLDRIDKVIFVGKYHASLYDGVIPKEKWFISGNGIEPQDFIDADGKYERVPHRMIYMSAYNRGLKILLDNWEMIKKEIPDATLDIYYGWQSYDAINSENPERMSWKNDLVKQIKSLDGVTDHGRISHKQIIEEINKADIFAYPCVFPEVYCISYVKAMAGGAYPVATDYAELVNYKDDGGLQIHYEEGKTKDMICNYITKLISTLEHSPKHRDEMINKARDKYSWYNTAKEWDKEFKE